MKTNIFFRSLIVLICTLPACSGADIDYLPTPGKVAFIGNSLTMYN